jgi:PTH1 family peptidyl-tRNA hydrolase
MVIHRWARALGVRLLSRRFEARSSAARLQDREMILLCPQTFMNLSGRSVKICVESLGVTSEEILVVHDDLDLPLGRVKVAKDGGDGGHKGIQSIFDHLGTHEFSRVKIGIGRPRQGQPVEEFVLSPFCREDKAAAEAVLQKAVHACELFVSEGIAAAMNQINRQDKVDLEA